MCKLNLQTYRPCLKGLTLEALLEGRGGGIFLFLTGSFQFTLSSTLSSILIFHFILKVHPILIFHFILKVHFILTVRFIFIWEMPQCLSFETILGCLHQSWAFHLVSILWVWGNPTLDMWCCLCQILGFVPRTINLSVIYTSLILLLFMLNINEQWDLYFYIFVSSAKPVVAFCKCVVGSIFHSYLQNMLQWICHFPLFFLPP